jgi:hypothetical protein
MASKYYVIVENPNGWDQYCPDWMGVFFGTADEFPGCEYSEDYRGIGCNSKRQAEQVIRRLNKSGDWTTDRDTGEETRPTYAYYPASEFVDEHTAFVAGAVMDVARNR